MKAHDTRRTGQSRVNGPVSVEASPSWQYQAVAGYELNIGATVTDDGVFFGSWGLSRTDVLGRDVRFWDKADGKVYGLDLSGQPRWGDGALPLDLVARCYEYAGRVRTTNDLLFCGFSPWLVTFYNGTVEGQPAWDADRNTLYVGRGDGRLFALDPDAGTIRWRYRTFNPALPDDPDGGGEIVTAPLVGPDGTVYFSTWGEGPYETNAVYAINPDSTLQWRYPTDQSLTHRQFASPALSPDASTLYFSGFLDDAQAEPALLLALHRLPTTVLPDTERRKWELPLTWQGRPVWTTTLAVGSDGTVYVGGYFTDATTNAPIPLLLAFTDTGTTAMMKWDPVVLSDGAQFVLGIALREEAGQTTRLYVTTANNGALFSNFKEEGQLYAVDPATGTVLAAYDPSDDVPEAIGSINSPAIGADGIVYFGVRGHYVGPFASTPVDGQVFAVTYDAANARFTRLWNEVVAGHIEWNHPAIGPDGGLYMGSSVGNGSSDPVYTAIHDPGVVPEGTTPTFYAFKGPTNPVATEASERPADAFQLLPGYPNPFTTTATFTVQMARPGPVRAEVVDLLGRVVRVLADRDFPAGTHPLVWDGRDATNTAVARGLYLVRLQTAGASAAQRAVRN
jgi:outer membrane protein assembly factor BamB